MKTTYPVIFTALEEGGYMAYSPDFEINTQGETLAEAICAARDAISLMGIDMQDEKKELPPSSIISPANLQPNEIVSIVDVDFDAYRRKYDQRTVRRTVSLPSYLNEAADFAGINVSAILREALKQELHMAE